MKIGQLAKLSGVSVRMLRYYETHGLLHPVRNHAGYRLYSRGDIDTVQRIVMLNRAGLSLETIRQLLPCALPDSPGFALCEKLKESVKKKLEEVDEQIDRLVQSRRLLASYLD